jgi:acyl-CoA dehydrogenase
MRTLLATLLNFVGERTPCPELAQWLPIWRTVQAASANRDPFVASLIAALTADRLAWAFFSGYQGALQSAFPDSIEDGRVGALCVHEAGRKMTEVTTSVEFRDRILHLHGKKSWALTSIEDLTLLVLARRSDGPQKGPGSLVMVRLPSSAVGVALGHSRPQAVVPELAHSEVCFEAVRLMPEQLVLGDGYAEHAKPFRVLEDIFVTGSTLAYLFAEAQSGDWPTTWRQRCIAAIAMLHACADLDPRDTRAHILVAGSQSFAGDVIRESENHWQAAQAIAHNRWQRDRPILSLGKEARRQRAIGSWARARQETGGTTRVQGA